MELQLVQNEQFKVRKTEYEGETWFVGRDVAQILGYKNHTASIPRHVEEDDRLNVTLDTPYGQRVTTLVNEIGVYSLVLGSKLPEAKAFKRWICKEVIPSIRSTGAYMTAETLAQVQGNPEALTELTTRLAEMQSKYQETLRLVQQHQKTIDQQGQLIERKNAYFIRNKPRIDFAKAVYENKTAILVGEMAKLLAQNGIEIGQNRFFEWLRQNGYLQSKQGEMWNVPYQKCIEQGIFIIKENVTTDNRGKELITRTPMVTGKGQRYFISKFLETKDEEALAAINEEELMLQSKDNLEPIGSDVAELEGIDGKLDELEGIDNEGNENIQDLAAPAAGAQPSQTYLELEAIA
ncbi:MAG: phage antirepressor KilAC domain-containing protein [Phascolarctobacterium sp.]|nr:phage antirepressor KilAC domain-containing protein [Phascolarctobacterium sp.]